MEFFVDNWDPGYGTPDAGAVPVQSSAQVKVDVERPGERWAPVPATQGLPVPAVIGFVDGVRRTDAHVTIVDGDGNSHLGSCVSYASGVVISNGRGARVVEPLVRRGLFTAAPDAEDIRSGRVEYAVDAVEATETQLETINLAVQRRLNDIELRTAAAARERSQGPDLLVVDGPIRGRGHLRRTIGVIKSHHSHYLPPEPGKVVARLGHCERTPVFHIGTSWDRYTWYLRLPARPGAPWKGVVRVECDSTLSADDAVRQADLSQAVLPAYASHEYKDPRAPVNLIPIGGLERDLRHRLGDRELLVRALRSVSA